MAFRIPPTKGCRWYHALVHFRDKILREDWGLEADVDFDLEDGVEVRVFVGGRAIGEQRYVAVVAEAGYFDALDEHLRASPFDGHRPYPRLPAYLAGELTKLVRQVRWHHLARAAGGDASLGRYPRGTS